MITRPSFLALVGVLALLAGTAAAVEPVKLRETPATASVIIESADLVVSGTGFDIATLEEDGQAWSNRGYRWVGVPESIKGWKYTRTAGGRLADIVVRAKRATTVRVLTNMDEPPKIKLTGWRKAKERFTTSVNKVDAQVFERELSAWQELKIPQSNWAGLVVLLPPSAQVTRPLSSPAPVTAKPPAPKPPAPKPSGFAGNPDVYRSGALVIVRDEQGAGSGFIAVQDGKRYLFTNAHVAAGMKRPVFTLLDGTILSPASVEAAVGHDIVRFGLKEEPAEALEIATSVAQKTRIDDEVVVFGNSRGGGVVTSLPGVIVGIGPDRIEVSSPFVPGNSGSPIIHVPTGRVLGVATYLTRKHEEFEEGGASSEVIRRFGYRLDSVKKWEPVNWVVFQADSDRVEKIWALTEDIFNFLRSLQKQESPVFATETLRKPAEEWRLTVSRRQLSPTDRNNATLSFLSSLRSMVRSDMTAAGRSLHYSYFREKLQQERVARDALYKSFDTELARISGSALQPR